METSAFSQKSKGSLSSSCLLPERITELFHNCFCGSRKEEPQAVMGAVEFKNIQDQKKIKFLRIFFFRSGNKGFKSNDVTSLEFVP